MMKTGRDWRIVASPCICSSLCKKCHRRLDFKLVCACREGQRCVLRLLLLSSMLAYPVQNLFQGAAHRKREVKSCATAVGSIFGCDGIIEELPAAKCPPPAPGPEPDGRGAGRPAGVRLFEGPGPAPARPTCLLNMSSTAACSCRLMTCNKNKYGNGLVSTWRRPSINSQQGVFSQPNNFMF